MYKRITSLLVLLLGVPLAACQTDGSSRPGPGFFSQASMRPVVQSTPPEQVQEAIACIRDTGVYTGIRFGIGRWTDGTLKDNHVAVGATGSFLSGATTSVYITQAVSMAGGIPLDNYNWQTEADLRSMLPEAVVKGAAVSDPKLNKVIGYDYRRSLQAITAGNMPEFFLQPYWVGLNFDGGPNVDAQFNGIGPILQSTGVTVGSGLDLVKVGGREVADQSLLKTKVWSTTLGLSFGRFIGNTLATGEATYTKQDNLQLESAETLAGLMVAQVLVDNVQVDEANPVCRPMVENLIGHKLIPRFRGPPPPRPPRVAYAK